MRNLTGGLLLALGLLMASLTIFGLLSSFDIYELRNSSFIPFKLFKQAVGTVGDRAVMKNLGFLITASVFLYWGWASFQTPPEDKSEQESTSGD